ncbi:unnamed protein product [Gordionus sp. m RMFG-2023]
MKRGRREENEKKSKMDLIDMQSQPDGENKYIFVYQDHFTKFVILKPMKNKTAQDVAEHLTSIFNLFGAPSILHTDNGREFKNETIQNIVEMWPGCKMVHGRPRHSQSQGSVERANKDIMNKLRCFLHDNKTTCWANALGTIQFQKNISYHRGIKSSPYEVMFGHKPNIWDSSLTKKLEDTGDDTAYLDDDKSYFHNLVNYTDSEDSAEFQKNPNSGQQSSPSFDLAEYENNSNSLQEYYPYPHLAEFENDSKSFKEGLYNASDNLADEEMKPYEDQLGHFANLSESARKHIVYSNELDNDGYPIGSIFKYNFRQSSAIDEEDKASTSANISV